MRVDLLLHSANAHRGRTLGLTRVHLTLAKMARSFRRLTLWHARSLRDTLPAWKQSLQFFIHPNELGRAPRRRGHDSRTDEGLRRRCGRATGAVHSGAEGDVGLDAPEVSVSSVSECAHPLFKRYPATAFRVVGHHPTYCTYSGLGGLLSPCCCCCCCGGGG